MTLSTLLVDDDRSFANLAQAALQREGFPVVVARSLHEARNRLGAQAPDLVILDRRLPDGDGLDFLPELKAQVPGCVVVMVTAHGDIASAVDAMRAGAADYLAKPVELADLVMKARRSAESIRLRDRLETAEAELSGRRRMVAPVSPAMKVVVEMLGRISASPRSPVLLLGETGAGKEVLARHLHELTAPAETFVHVNCAALPDTTFESELFGHERGAFTDARSARRGLVEVASGGTLFLDEIGELPLPLQAKLLTYLDSGRFRRLGGTTEHQSLARVVAATNRDLAAQVADGSFREDLWFRLSVFRVEIPSLRQRREDILPLAQGILEELQRELGRKHMALAPAAKERLLAYPFPGNVRELHNVLERALVLERGPVLNLDWLQLPGAPPPQPAEPASPTSSLLGPGELVPMEELEKRYARYVLDRLGGRRMEAARTLGLSYPTFLKRVEED